MSNTILAASLLAAKATQLGDEAQAILAAGAHWLHLDVMDNHYVPNLSFGPHVCSALRGDCPQSFIDVHLMTQPVDALISPFAQAGADLISFHPESSAEPLMTLQRIKSQGVLCGLALNPFDGIDVLKPYWSHIDLVLIMSVIPGFGGQSFMEEVLPKISAAREKIDQLGRPIRLQVDGGINPITAARVLAAGADTLVAGSALFKHEDYGTATAALLGP